MKLRDPGKFCRTNSFLKKTTIFKKFSECDPCFFGRIVKTSSNVSRGSFEKMTVLGGFIYPGTLGTLSKNNGIWQNGFVWVIKTKFYMLELLSSGKNYFTNLFVYIAQGLSARFWDFGRNFSAWLSRLNSSCPGNSLENKILRQE